MAHLPKEARCKYNTAREVYKQFKPYCVWPEQHIKNLPPHFYIASKGEANCRSCKCFEESITPP